jgi:hypothetical protein
MSGWYFGKWQHRLDWSMWQMVWGRVKFEIAAVIAVPLMFLGAILGLRDTRIHFMRLWAIGALIYLLIFFTLNFIHDYYQIPLIAPVAFFIALPLYHLHRLLCSRNRALAGLVLIVVMSGFAWQCIRLTEGIHLNTDEQVYLARYYQPDPLPQKAGELIRQHTPDNAFVISTYGGLDVRCPLILYHARRLGWSIAKQHLSVPILERLIVEGATHFALLQIENPDPALEVFLSKFSLERHLLPGTNWPLRIYHLRNQQ